MTFVMHKELHDVLLSFQPADAKHDPLSCSYCTPELASLNTQAPGGSVTDEEIKALRDRNADLETQIKAFEAAQQTTTTDAKVAEVRAELELKVVDLQAQLDTAVLEAAGAKAEVVDIVAYLTAEVATAAAAAHIEAVRDERLVKVAEVATFPAEYILANTDRWASMSDEAFALALTDYAAVAVKPLKAEAVLPPVTALTASRHSEPTTNPMRELAELRFSGVDITTL